MVDSSLSPLKPSLEQVSIFADVMKKPCKSRFIFGSEWGSELCRTVCHSCQV